MKTVEQVVISPNGHTDVEIGRGYLVSSLAFGRAARQMQSDQRVGFPAGGVQFGPSVTDISANSRVRAF